MDPRELPAEPGAYQDPRGDVWLLGKDGLWEHGARRLDDGRWLPVMGRFTGRMTPEAFAHLASGPGVEPVLPMTRVEVGEHPPAE